RERREAGPAGIPDRDLRILRECRRCERERNRTGDKNGNLTHGDLLPRGRAEAARKLGFYRCGGPAAAARVIEISARAGRLFCRLTAGRRLLIRRWLVFGFRRLGSFRASGGVVVAGRLIGAMLAVLAQEIPCASAPGRADTDACGHAGVGYRRDGRAACRSE